LDRTAFPALFALGIVAACTLSAPPMFRERFGLFPLAVNQVVLSIAIAMLVGRLDSGLMGSSLTLLPLYFYSAIQLMIPFVLQATGGVGFWLPAVLAIALVLKIYLFLYVSWLLETTLLARYIWVMRSAQPLNLSNYKALEILVDRIDEGAHVYQAAAEVDSRYS
jgi:hypothetical protein